MLPKIINTMYHTPFLPYERKKNHALAHHNYDIKSWYYDILKNYKIKKSKLQDKHDFFFF